ncbi:Probable poly(beta-D-mannuronate) O-acetylase [hydrothermal vent metagenome]|uniref:Probable poly(Beta-D-mannuronate) O-acetylase n=1 Tax=hydrothermal vent metagenome TaxID=652676 RepID=A0A3B1DM82_9ZZZZ
MNFNAYTFILFFAIVLAFHYAKLRLIPQKWRWATKKSFLLMASYLFYAAWNPPFVVLLWVSTVIDWFMAKGIHSTQQQWKKRLFLAGSLSVNLGLMAYYKYGGFILDNFIDALSSAGIKYQPVSFSIALPVGISFFTFQTLSYTLDIYRGKMKPWNSRIDFALFVTFFPQLVAGPIVRAIDFQPQLQTERRATASQFHYGLWLLIVGLFQKVVLADGILAPIVNKVYAPETVPGTLNAWAGTLAFAGQIFCDFAGYSSCAIGAALCLGFVLPTNFRYPYAAVGFSDFWRRWHITLSEWLRDYLYIPLGGNRKGKVRTLCNLCITMLLGGLWHGASWTFVVWGAMHGFLLMAEQVIRALPIAQWNIWKSRPGQLFLAFVTFIMICLTWVFFRAKTFSQAFIILASMFGFVSTSMPLLHLYTEKAAVALLVILLITLNHRALRDMSDEDFELRVHQSHWLKRSVALASMLIMLTVVSGKNQAFIYFKF